MEKVSTGRPHVVDAVKNNEIQLILNTGASTQTKMDGYEIRRAAIRYKVPYATTTDGTKAICKAIKALNREPLSVKSIQNYHTQGKGSVEVEGQNKVQGNGEGKGEI